MTRTKGVRDMAASVRQRLLNLAIERGTDYNLMLQRFVGERFLYRLGLSSEVDRFTLKGAALLLVWTGHEIRATRDVDLLRSSPSDHPALRKSLEEICSLHSPEDGIVFDPSTIRIAEIREGQADLGTRVKLRANLGTAILPLQVDVGFGDAITPERQVMEYPTLLGHPAPRVWMYPRETFLAEKFEAMVGLGPMNTRMKDFWDVAALAGRFPFDGETLRSAIEETFRRRRMTFTGELPVALSPAFYEDPARIRQWEAFQDRAGVTSDAPIRFDEAGEMVRAFLGPVRESLVQDEPFTRTWPEGGPWEPSSIKGGAVV